MRKELYEPLIQHALEEDLWGQGDVTSQSIFAPADEASAMIVAKAEGVLAGAEIAAAVFEIVNPMVEVQILHMDGDELTKRSAVLKVHGPTVDLLIAERTSLNFLGHLSGIATATHHLVKAIEGTKAHIVDTRKTTPGLRALEKYAVRCGGGLNHRYGLYDAVLIKDNHIAAVGSPREALRRAKARSGHLVKIEIEVGSFDQLPEVLEEGADVIMLDNMTPDQVHEAVCIIDGRAKVEASGGITLETARAYAEAGVDLISVGWITHSAPRLDLSLEF